MHTCLYEGWVVHRRREPVAHNFRYQLSLLYLDLEEIEQAFRGRWLWSIGRPNAVSFRREDYLGDASLPLVESVRQVLVEAGLGDVHGPVRLLTQPRYFGFLMNPVSFYYCFDRDEALAAVVAEVTNTPWGERKSYVLGAGHSSTGRLEAPVLVRKQLHVSPFLPMDMHYRWRLSVPGEQLRARIGNLQQGRTIFEAALRLKRCAWTAQALRRHLLRYPLLTQRVAAAIYWQAWNLWWKGCPFYANPGQRPPARSSEPLPTSNL